nr:transposase [Leptospira inadai]
MGETLAYIDFPSEHWRKIRTNNPLERRNSFLNFKARFSGWFG